MKTWTRFLPTDRMRTERRLRLIEFVLWVCVITTLVVTFSLVIGLAIGGGLVTVKYMLFIFGFILVGVGTFILQPSRPHKDKKRFSVDDPSQSRIEAYIQELPPLRDNQLRFDDRIGRAPKLFVAGLLVLGVSLFIGLGLGVTGG